MEQTKLVQIVDDEATKLNLTSISLSEKLLLSNDGKLMIMVKPSDGGQVTVNANYELSPEELENQPWVPKGTTHYSIEWGQVIGGNMFDNGKQAYLRFYK